MNDSPPGVLTRPTRVVCVHQGENVIDYTAAIVHGKQHLPSIWRRHWSVTDVTGVRRTLLERGTRHWSVVRRWSVIRR